MTSPTHRAELTALERAEHVAEWVRLTEGKVQSAQLAPIESKRDDKGNDLGLAGAVGGFEIGASCAEIKNRN